VGGDVWRSSNYGAVRVCEGGKVKGQSNGMLGPNSVWFSPSGGDSAGSRSTSLGR
jgi:hypothetical protein